MPLPITCPKCRAVFQISGKTPPGTTLKCPKCAKAFALPAAPAKAKPAPAAVGAARGKSAASSSGSFPGTDGGGGIVAVPDAVLRARNSFGAKMKRAMRKALIFGLLLLCLASVVFLGWKYGTPAVAKLLAKGDTAKTTDGSTATSEREKPPPEPIRYSNQGTGLEDPLAFVPADANLIIGFSGAAFLENPTLKPLMENALVQLGLVTTLAECKNQTGRELRELFDNVVIATKLGMPGGTVEHTTYVLRSSVPFDQKKVGQWATSDPPKKLGGKVYYDKHRELKDVKTVYMPASNMVVLSDLPANRFDTVFASDGSKPAVPADVVPLVRQVEKNLVWMVMPFTGKLQDDIKAGGGPMHVFNVIMPPEVQPTIRKILPDAKGLTFRLSLDKNQCDVAMGVGCANDKLADEMVKTLQGAWTRHKPKQAKKVTNAILFQALERQQVVKEMMESLNFARQNTVAEATVKTTFDSLKPLFTGGGDAFQVHVLETLTQMTTELGMALLPERPVTLAAEEKAFLDLVNQYRQKAKKLPPLKPSTKLMEVARSHATNMAKEAKAEDELDGKDTPTRAKEAGFKFKLGGLESIIAAGDKMEPAQALESFVKSNQEVLVGDFEETGIGIVKDDKGKVYYYQIFGTPDK